MFSNAFVDRDLMAKMTAKMLLEVEAVHFNAEKPYTFTSGLASPVYIDCRKLISYPRIRETLMDFPYQSSFAMLVLNNLIRLLAARLPAFPLLHG